MTPSKAVRADGKVVVHFRHTGDAPILKQSKFKVPADAQFQVVTELLRKHLGLASEDPLVRVAAHKPASSAVPSLRPLAVRSCELTVLGCCKCGSFCIATAPSRHRQMSLSRMWLPAFTSTAFLC